MKLSIRTVVLGGMFLVMAACGGVDDDDSVATNVPFPPVPTPTPVALLCGNGQLEEQFEECDIGQTQNCGAGEACVCCVCAGDQGLGERTFDFANIPTSQFLNSFLGSNVAVAGSLAGDPLILRGGPLTAPSNPSQPFADECQAPLTLAQDAIFGLRVLDSSFLCVKVFAEGSSGAIDCDGGTAQDVRLDQDSQGTEVAAPAVLTTDLLGPPPGAGGDPGAAGPGAATLIVPRFMNVRLPAEYGLADCRNIDYDNPRAFDSRIARADVIDVQPDAFTTQMSTTTLFNAAPPPDKMFSVFAGGNFRCGSFSDPNDAPRALAIPVPGEDTPIGDTANALLLKECDVNQPALCAPPAAP